VVHPVSDRMILLFKVVRGARDAHIAGCHFGGDTHITSDMCAGIHISRGYTYHCETGTGVNGLNEANDKSSQPCWMTEIKHPIHVWRRWHYVKKNYFLTCTRCDRTSSFKLSKSAWVRDKAMTSAPHSTNILAVLRPIPLNKTKSCVFHILKEKRRLYKLSSADLTLIWLQVCVIFNILLMT